MPSGVAHLDALLGGGVDRGSSMLIIGAAGVGKSTLASQFAVAGARRGEKAAVFIFDETVWTFRARAEKLGFPMTALSRTATLTLRQIDSAEVSAGQFTNMVMQAVDGGVSTVVIDSLDRLPEHDAGGAVPGRLSSRAADDAEPPERRHRF